MNAEQMEEIKRHFGVVAESLRSDIRQIAEGHATIRHELQDLRGEFRDEFKEMRAPTFLSVALSLSFINDCLIQHPCSEREGDAA